MNVKFAVGDDVVEVLGTALCVTARISGAALSSNFSILQKARAFLATSVFFQTSSVCNWQLYKLPGKHSTPTYVCFVPGAAQTPAVSAL